ncbi:glycerophosphodiester phosphodiesterase family protein [Catenulispora subtropica]|uniref:Glycerophosphodiester phosphodiesterase n=1 Tax=Catenulispora subtropica TaxID=450798 RepID=A0ABN2TDG8_9ACTN
MAPRTARHPFLDHDAPIPFAHRGGAAGPAGENTLAAFRLAVQTGYRYLETDVHASSDGVLLAFHDRRLHRVTDAKGRISAMSAAEISKARIGDEPVPTMAELLEAFPDARFNIDVKEPNTVAPLAELLRRADALERVCVSSFSDARLAAMREALGGRVCTSAGPREAWRMWRASRRLKPGEVPDPAALPRLAADCLQLPPALGRIVVVDERLLAAAHAAGLPVHVWTINDDAEMDRLLELGVDGVMTDRLDTLKTVLTKRGTWS